MIEPAAAYSATTGFELRVETALPPMAQTSVVGVFAVGVVGDVTHPFQLGNACEQGLLDTLLQRDVRLTATLATTTELQDGNAFVDDIDQAHLAAVAGQPGVDLGLQVVVDALVQWAVFVDHRHLGIRRLDGQLAAHAVGGVVDQRIFEEGFAGAVDPGGEALQRDRHVVRLLFTGLAIGNAGFRVGGAGLSDEDTDADPLGVLLLEQIGQVIVCGFGNGNGAHGNSSQTCRAVYANHRRG